MPLAAGGGFSDSGGGLSRAGFRYFKKNLERISH
jgi:hypothetical protein